MRFSAMVVCLGHWCIPELWWVTWWKKIQLLVFYPSTTPQQQGPTVLPNSRCLLWVWAQTWPSKMVDVSRGFQGCGHSHFRFYTFCSTSTWGWSTSTWGMYEAIFNKSTWNSLVNKYCITFSSHFQCLVLNGSLTTTYIFTSCRTIYTSHLWPVKFF